MQRRLSNIVRNVNITTTLQKIIQKLNLETKFNKKKSRKLQALIKGILNNYLDDILDYIGEIVESGPLEGVVAVSVRLGDRNAVGFDEFSKFVEIAVGGSGENVDNGNLGRVLRSVLLIVGIGNDLDLG